MLSLPLDSSLVLLVLSEPRPQIKDRQTGEIAVDRDTKMPLYQVDLALSVPGMRPQVLQVSLQQDGLPQHLSAGSPVRAEGLMYVTGEKNGRRWEIYRATALHQPGANHTTNGGNGLHAVPAATSSTPADADAEG